MTGRPSGRCAAQREALNVMEEEGGRDGNLVFFPADSWHALRAALASPCCEGADQEQVKEALETARLALVLGAQGKLRIGQARDALVVVRDVLARGGGERLGWGDGWLAPEPRICPNCGEKEPHYLLPSKGENGRFVCQPDPERVKVEKALARGGGQQDTG